MAALGLAIAPWPRTVPRCLTASPVAATLSFVAPACVKTGAAVSDTWLCGAWPGSVA